MPDVYTTESGEVQLNGSARLSAIASDAALRSSYPLLAEACALEASRGAGRSLADSLGSATACGSTADGVACALNGSSVCAAKNPSTPLHAIIPGGPCWRAYTSLPGVALHALDAAIEFGEGPDAMSVLRVRLPGDSANGFQHFLVGPQNVDAGVAAISVAAVRRTDGDVRIVIGGVAPSPYRVYTSVEEEAMAGGLDEETIAGLADRALLDAETQPASAMKLEAATALLRTAIEEIAANSP